MNQKIYHDYRVSFLGETTIVRSDVSQQTLKELNSIIEKAIFEINQGKISGNKIETLMLVALKLASEQLILQNKVKSQSKIENKISSIKKKMESFSI